MSKLNFSKLLLIITLFLSACGGGGGGEDTNSPSSNSSLYNHEESSLKVNAGGDRIAQINTQIEIKGYITGDIDNINSYEWRRGDQTLATTLTFSYIPTEIGIETLTLIVTDNNGNTFVDQTHIKVVQEYQDDPLPF
jgi:hypothetical protein